MKVFSVSAALDAGVIKPNDTVDVEGGRLQVGKGTITDTHPHNVISIGEVVKYSSNVGAIKIARKLGREGLHHGLQEFGFGTRTGIELPGESRGLLRDASALGRDRAGDDLVRLRPACLADPDHRRARRGGQRRHLLPAEHREARWSAPTARSLYAHASRRRIARSCRRRDLARHDRDDEDGRAEGRHRRHLFVPGFVVAGKTGTAYKHDPATKHYSHDRYLASFMGFAPADNPRLAILVMIDDPRGDVHYGADVAAPVFGVIMGESLKYLGVAGDPDAPTAADPSPRR